MCRRILQAVVTVTDLRASFDQATDRLTILTGATVPDHVIHLPLNIPESVWSTSIELYIIGVDAYAISHWVLYNRENTHILAGMRRMGKDMVQNTRVDMTIKHNVGIYILVSPMLLAVRHFLFHPKLVFPVKERL